MTGVRGLAHANIRAPEAMIERLRSFYIDLIGLREGSRPTFRSARAATGSMPAEPTCCT